MSVQDHRLQTFARSDVCNVEAAMSRAELFRAECNRLILETEKACKRLQDEDSKHLEQRLKDIQFQKKELELRLEEILSETQDLKALQGRVRKAQETNKEARKVNILCLDERRKVAPCGKMHDEVNSELLKEKQTLEEVASLLHTVQEQISEQIRLNMSAKYSLEVDLKEKFQAESIDGSCSLMSVRSVAELHTSKPNIRDQKSSTVSPKQWEDVSELNMTKAEQQKSNSLTLKALVESVLVQTAADTQAQFKATREALQLNIQQVKTVKSQLEEQLPKVQSEISNQQRVREDLQAAIAEKERFLSVAHSRLALRHQRPSKERCSDSAQTQLLAEVQQLAAHIHMLRQEVARSEEEQRALVRCQLELKKSIDTKAESLYIDEVVCMQHRDAILIPDL
ncbi:tektin-1 isoform X2 [Cyprinodon tularosa]|uniref:tektin-1 isoform X2 n=1 Tax=Cyprinodon tularosa TaxID=77115 RepID=UPI0018E24883|nr:tektin-1 isoform X2 [Cyprinodon tularosa]